ncbi:unnamed protein product [Malus baccata var. baccata]
MAAVADWDEESLLIASRVVDETAERDFKHRRRSVLDSKTPPTNSSRIGIGIGIAKIEGDLRLWMVNGH